MKYEVLDLVMQCYFEKIRPGEKDTGRMKGIEGEE
jgi:hypothetical protein